MNVLIVDDDRFVVSALEKQIDWATLGIDAVYCAYNIRQAQKILENQSVQIMVSDIEMPQGSGLDLLQWIRQSNRKLQVIFLTSYSDFHYAQQALELQSLNYLLKPIEFEKLTEIIHQAALRIQAEERDEEDRENSRFWKVNRKNLITHFWHNLLSGKIISSKDGISGVLAEEKLNYTLSDAFLPLLIQVYPDTPEIQGWEKTSFDYGLKNMMEELFGSLLLETVFKLSSDDRWVVLLEAAEIKLTETVSSICKTFIESVGHYLNCEVRCSIGQIGTLTRIYPEFLKLEDMNKNRVSCRGGIFRLDAYRPKEPVYTPPPTELLEILLRENKADAFLRQAGAYLDGLVAADRLNHAVLELIRLDLTQLIYAVLRQKEIDAHLLFYNQTHETLESRALFSVQDFKRYLEYLVQTSVEYQHFTTQSKSIVEIIVEYIEHHYMEDISRKSLSDIVFLNPDYLASLFKKELGISLGTYLAGKRIETAKELLLKSDLPISVISLNVGYSNYSYFSHLFKDAVGCTPAEYRKQNH